MARVQSDVGVSAEDERISQCSNCLGSDEEAAKYGDTDRTGDNYNGGGPGMARKKQEAATTSVITGRDSSGRDPEKSTTTIGADRGAADPNQSIFGPLPTEIGLKEAADPRLVLSDNQ